MKARLKLSTGEKFCDKCSGTGFVVSQSNPDLEDLCPKCRGKRKLDWIENIVGVTRQKSVLDQVNTRKSIRRIENFVITVISELWEDKKKIQLNISSMLEGMRQGRDLYDYKIDIDEIGNKVNIFFKPSRSVEFIEIVFEVN